jgi:hypothetical protein
MNNNEITTSCEPSTIHPDLPISGNHDSDRRSMAPSVPTHNENHNYHDPSNTCIHDMDHAHANSFNPIVVPKATSLIHNSSVCVVNFLPQKVLQNVQLGSEDFYCLRKI